MQLDDIDLTDLDLFADGFPDEVFALLRREAPVWWHPPTHHTPDGVGFWVVSRHADVLEVVGDAEVFSSEGLPGGTGGGTLIQDLPYAFAAGVLLNMLDDPRHHHIRRLVTPAVAPRGPCADRGRAEGADRVDPRCSGLSGGAVTSCSTSPSNCRCRPSPW